MIRKAISTAEAPKAIGPYSQAILVAPAAAPGPGGASTRTIFCSGQIPIDPSTGEFVGAGDVKQQTHRVMQSLGAVLSAAGASMGAIVKTTIFLTDLADFAAVNETYAGYFAGPPPARSTVQVAALPRGAKVEIDAIALVDA